MFNKGDKVKILASYQDEGDARYIWEVVADEDRGHVEIKPVNFEFEFAPISQVRSYMIESAS